MLGNVSPTGVFLNGSPEDVIKASQECLDAWVDGTGYILSVGCDFPKEVSFENIEALMSFKSKCL